IVRRLLGAKIDETPAIIGELAGYRRWADPQLEQVLADPGAGSDHQLHARLGLLPVDRRQVAPLREDLLGANANDFRVIRDALSPYRDDLVEGLWEIVESGR